MSFLYPLFLAGIAAVALPIIMHMIRRQTRKQVTFSSLMFLRTTVPRFKNRSRIENLPLLILRCIILGLLAFAFSRPFFPREVGASRVPVAKRIVLLIDTSASMQRTGIWPRAINAARSALEDVSPNDRVCIMKFDQNAETLIGFEQWQALDSGRRTATASEQLVNLSPGWASTNLGRALVYAAEAIGDDEVNDGQKSRTHQIMLISDLQKGSDLGALQAYEWPEALELDVRLIAAADSTNAALQLIVNRDRPSGKSNDELQNVRITNSPDADIERFGLGWAGEAQLEESDQKKEVYVPAGHSVVVRAPKRTDSSPAGKLVLIGDQHDFDNTLYVSPRLIHKVNILFVGSDDAADPEGMLYYIQRAFRATGSIDPAVIVRSVENLSNQDITATHLIIATDALKPGQISSVHKYLESGKTVLLVTKSSDSAETIAALAGIESIESQEADVDTYTMLNRIDFKHPLFVPFSESRFGDFTGIHFWKHRKISIDDLPGTEVLAWFDSNDPALFEMRVDGGSLLVLTSGWNPSDSQLALSSKFVPLLYSILEYSGVSASRQSQYFVGDHVEIPHKHGSGTIKPEIRKPDGSVVALDAGQESFTQTDLPGIYTISGEGVPPSHFNKQGRDAPETQEQDALATNRLFALNLSPKESQTAVIPIEDIEGLGVSIAQSSDFSIERAKMTNVSRNTQASNLRRSAALESEQKIWRWIIIGLLAFSFMEIAMAGWLTHPPSSAKGGQK